MGLTPDLVSPLLKGTSLAPPKGKPGIEAYLLAGLLSMAGGEAFVGNKHAERIADEIAKVSDQVAALRESMAGASARDAEHDRRLEKLESTLLPARRRQ
jgi:hypothetical protein